MKLTLPAVPFGNGSAITPSDPMREFESPPCELWMRVCITTSAVLTMNASSPLLNCWAICAEFACRASVETRESMTNEMYLAIPSRVCGERMFERHLPSLSFSTNDPP